MKRFFNFCKAVAVLALASGAALALNACQQTQKEKTIGIQLYSVMDAVKENPQASIERLAGMGYNAFELVQWGGDPKVFGLPAEEFKAICDDPDQLQEMVNRALSDGQDETPGMQL